MSVTITEIIRRSDQGVTRPFHCRGDNGKWYWVKGNYAGKAALCCEWIAGRLAQAFGLPVPPIEQAFVPRDVIEYSARDDAHDLGAGFVFASEHVDGADDMRAGQVGRVPAETRRAVLAFDWWIQNMDRSLGGGRSNVNMLWVPGQEEQAHVIDHNIAFDSHFNMADFKRNHVFRGEFDKWDASFSLALEPRIMEVRAGLQGVWDEIPEEWVDDALLAPQFSLRRISAVLDRYKKADDLFGCVAL